MTKPVFSKAEIKLYLPEPFARITKALSSIGVGVTASGKGLPAESVVPIVPIDLSAPQNSMPFLVNSITFFLLFKICNAPETSLN